MQKVLLSRDDLFCIRVKDAEESEVWFGPYHLEEYGTEIPPELLERYQKIQQEYDEIQAELYDYYRGKTNLED